MTTALEALRAYQQADEDGVMVLVSRQACDECAAEIERLRADLQDFGSWCENERTKLGALDGYDYRSGEEYGLRRAQIELERRINPSTHEQKANP